MTLLASPTIPINAESISDANQRTAIVIFSEEDMDTKQMTLLSPAFAMKPICCWTQWRGKRNFLRGLERMQKRKIGCGKAS